MAVARRQAAYSNTPYLLFLVSVLRPIPHLARAGRNVIWKKLFFLPASGFDHTTSRSQLKHFSACLSLVPLSYQVTLADNFKILKAFQSHIRFATQTKTLCVLDIKTTDLVPIVNSPALLLVYFSNSNNPISIPINLSHGSTFIKKIIINFICVSVTLDVCRLMMYLRLKTINLETHSQSWDFSPFTQTLFIYWPSLMKDGNHNYVYRISWGNQAVASYQMFNINI